MLELNLGHALPISDTLAKMRAEYRKNKIPTILDESLNLLLLVAAIASPKRILEIGTSVGVSGSALLQLLPEAKLTTIEKDEETHAEAKKNFEKLGVLPRVRLITADAGEVLRNIDGEYDFIFLDGAKSKYFDYLPDAKRLLRVGGVMVADNVLFRGFVDGSKSFTHSDNTIVRNMRAFLNEISASRNFLSEVFGVGDGVLVACKIRTT